DKLKKLVLKAAMRIVRSPACILIRTCRFSFHSPSSPAIEDSQQIATILKDRHRQPAKPRREVSDEIDRFFDVTALELSWDRVKVWKDIRVRLDHFDLDRILAPTLMRHVGKDLVEHQMIFVLIVNGRCGEWR